MDKIKPSEKIASQFGISLESAKYFLGRVQKSFKKEKPPHALILEFIEAQEYEYLPTPYDVASLMHESGVWAEALNSTPLILVDQGDSDLGSNE
jgi:hypothetical protein